MSHFTVLVIGDDVDTALYPFREYDGSKDFPKDLLVFDDRTKEVKKEYETGAASNKVPFSQTYPTVEAFAEDWHGYEKHKGKFGRWHNPNSKWDWYELGGRWQGSLRLKKNGAQVDQAKAEEVDWAYVDQAEYESHIAFWEIYVEGSRPARSEDEKKLGPCFYKKEYYTSRYANAKEYATAQTAFHTYAVIKDGKWLAKGEMGWFGFSSDEGEDSVRWSKNFYDNFIRSIHPKTMVSVVDCHI